MVAEKINLTRGMKELEGLVADFETREIDLEKDLPRFERALHLAGLLHRRLKEIENKVSAIDKKFSMSYEDNDEKP
jgi:exodeoxyribonuclease VII small subunit